MSMRSELVQLVVDDHGKTTTYYTYTGYYSAEDRQKMKEYQRKIEQRCFTAAFLTAMFAYYTSRKTNMADFTYRSYLVRKRGLLSGVAGFVGSYLVYDEIGTRQRANFEQKIALNSENLPLWVSKRAAVNPDRVYFELIDSNDNEPSIFHSGLTPESAAELIPDRLIGSTPSKPHRPQSH